MSSPSDATLGHAMRKHFLFREQWVNLNHGCFGSYPRQVANVRSNLLEKVESAPDVFLRYDHLPLLNESRGKLAQYLHVPADEIVLVGNATLAINTVLRNLTYNDKDTILYFESVYDAVEMTLLSLKETWPQISLHKVDYGVESKRAEYAKSHDGICKSFIQAVSQIHAKGFRVKVAIFETISSIPAIRLPFERLTQICQGHGVLSLIDGAHGIGQIPLNLSELNADFFISNCHKWLYVPRGCAVFHVPKRNQHLIRTAFPTSWEFELQSNGGDSPGRFLNQYQAQATSDNTPFYCVPAALEFREQVCGGELAIYKYCKEIVHHGADIIAQKLGTVVMQEPVTEVQHNDSMTQRGNSFTGLRDCAMANILLPLKISESHIDAEGITLDSVGHVTGWMQKVLPVDFHTSVSFFDYRGYIWVRLMGQVYLELSDFEWFAGVLLEVCKRVNMGEPFVDKGR